MTVAKKAYVATAIVSTESYSVVLLKVLRGLLCLNPVEAEEYSVAHSDHLASYFDGKINSIRLKWDFG